MVALVHFNLNSNFPALNQALYDALNGNWTGFSYTALEPVYTSGILDALPTMCLDLRQLFIFVGQMS